MTQAPQSSFAPDVMPGLIPGAPSPPMPHDMSAAHRSAVLLRTVVIGLTAFLTVVDLFSTQAILPSLARAYAVSPAAMGFAVNASTMGMAVAGLTVVLIGVATRGGVPNGPTPPPRRAPRDCSRIG